MDRDLLDVRAAVKDVHQQVSDWPVVNISDHPCPPVPLEGSQVFQGERLVVSDRVHREFSERRASGLFQGLQQGELVAASGTDRDGQAAPSTS
jgi:hypothetical protein